MRETLHKMVDVLSPIHRVILWRIHHATEGSNVTDGSVLWCVKLRDPRGMVVAKALSTMCEVITISLSLDD